MSTDGLKNATLCFLVEQDGDTISRVCLGMKKRGFAQGKWNGIGGKADSENCETIKAAVTRETREELDVELIDPVKVGELICLFPYNPTFGQHVHVFLAHSWKGDIKETEEISPEWFSVDTLPFVKMWPDEQFWLPLVFSGKKIKARFVFAEGDLLTEKEINVVDGFD